MASRLAGTRIGALALRGAASMLAIVALAHAGEGEYGAWGGGGRWEFGEGACYHCRLLAERAELEASAPYEPGTGRDLRNYAPDRLVDFQHMRLDIDIPDMNKRQLTAKQTLSLSPIAQALEVLTLDAAKMEIQSVSIPDDSPLSRNTTVEFTYDDNRLALRFDPPVPPGQEVKVVVNYTLNDPPDGLFWTPESPQWPGRPAQIHTQGQPDTNRYWFPAHDFPNERLSTEIVATVPEGFLVSANGREASKPRTSGGRTTFHWLQDKPHVPYLVSMIVGKFDVKDVAPAGSKIPMPVYVPPGKEAQIKRTYGRTPDMVRVFEERFDEPYPWDRYAQLVVWNFGAGGMENTSATTMYDTAILEDKAFSDGDLDGLISHELGHQWFGDLITCNTWAHIWLNEGWATYCTGLWLEARDGYEDGYINYMYRTMRGIARRDQLAPDSTATRPPMVSREYRQPWEVFRRVSNPYPKGASILHMLRARLGDELFFKCVAEYIDRFKYKTAETDDFRRTLEDVSGVSLEQFFEQWAFRPGTPKVHVKARWDNKKNELTLTIRQQQRIDASNPAYRFTLPIEISTRESISSGEEPRPMAVSVEVDGAFHERTFTLDAEPAMVLVDPDLHVLMDIDVEMPRSWLTNQLYTPRSIASRLDAARFLRGKGGRATTEALARKLADTDEWYTVRAEAADSLGDLSEAGALEEAMLAGIEDARVRLAVIENLAKIGGPGPVKLLAASAADDDESFACRAAALEGLARRGGAEYMEVIEAGLRASSQHEQVRVGALRGLAWLNTKEALLAAIPYTQFGQLSRVRPEAIGVVAKLSELDKDAAYAAVAPLLEDTEARTRTSAGAALVEIEDQRGLADLDRFIATTRNAEERERAIDWRAALAARLAGVDSKRSTGAEIEKLKGDLKRLESRLQDKE